MIAAIQDFSESKQFEQGLNASIESTKTATSSANLLLAVISHELRTPLQTVLGHAEFLLRGPRASLTAEQLEDINSIHAGADRMMLLINQMLDLTRIEAGRFELAIDVINLARVIEQVRQDVWPQLQAKSLTLTVDQPSTLPLILGDPRRVHQILLNLVENAVKFTDEGEVQITARTTDVGIDVTVSDTGIGIAPADLEHIFEEFWQADSRTTRRYEGAGLGLAIVKRLAEQMGSTISVESSLERGSSFTLHLIAAG